MLEVKREWPRLDLDLLCSHESGLEPDTFLADIALGTSLRALTDTADRVKIFLSEAIFIAFHNKPVMINGK
jgi:hypothetical protein